MPQWASATPRTPPSNASRPLSAKSCCISRCRSAPREARTAYSLRRVSVRDCKRFATFAQAINKTKDTAPRSEEHTSELQSRLHLVCRLLLEKKKKKQ